MKAAVVDASVAVKWYLPANGEELVEQAFDLLSAYRNRKITLFAPDLLWAEFGNVMSKAVRSGRVSEATAQLAITDILAWQFQIVNSDALLSKALTLAVSENRSFYDSLYVALAARLNIDLITADERLANALSTRFPVRWLGSFSIT